MEKSVSVPSITVFSVVEGHRSKINPMKLNNMKCAGQCTCRCCK